MKPKWTFAGFGRPKWKIKASAITLFWLTVVLAFMSFAHKRQQNRVCQHVEVNIHDQNGNYYLESEDVLRLISHQGEDGVINQTFEALHLRALESKIDKHGYVLKSQVYRDFKGNLYLDVFQEEPYARLALENGNDRFVSKEGKILPVSERFTPRVMVLYGPFNNFLAQKSWTQDTIRQSYLTFLREIQQDKFLRLMVASAHISRHGHITIYPQLGKQSVEYGLPQNIHLKNQMLKVFYHKIIPLKGWNKYARVNLQYKNQIICE